MYCVCVCICACVHVYVILCATYQCAINRWYARSGGVAWLPFWVAKRHITYRDQYKICLVVRVLDTSSLDETSNFLEK